MGIDRKPWNERRFNIAASKKSDPTNSAPSGMPHGKVVHHPRSFPVQVQLRLEARVPGLADSGDGDGGGGGR